MCGDAFVIYLNIDEHSVIRDCVFSGKLCRKQNVCFDVFMRW
jgi:NifU-like protein involved in Fe-S cluster formation